MRNTRKQEMQHQYGAASLFACVSNGRPSITFWQSEAVLTREGSPPVT